MSRKKLPSVGSEPAVAPSAGGKVTTAPLDSVSSLPLAGRMPPGIAPPSSAPAPRATALLPSATAQAVAPLSPDRYTLQLTISGETYETLQRVRALMRHTDPSGDLAEIIGRALALLLDDLERRRCAMVTAPRESGSANGRSRHIPAAVRREVWRRDEGRCAFVAASGRRCTERGFLEFHHVQPYADGGAATVTNIELRCNAHNLHEGRLFFDGHGGVRESRAPYG